MPLVQRLFLRRLPKLPAITATLRDMEQPEGFMLRPEMYAAKVDDIPGNHRS